MVLWVQFLPFLPKLSVHLYKGKQSSAQRDWEETKRDIVHPTDHLCLCLTQAVSLC